MKSQACTLLPTIEPDRVAGGERRARGRGATLGTRTPWRPSSSPAAARVRCPPCCTGMPPRCADRPAAREGWPRLRPQLKIGRLPGGPAALPSSPGRSCMRPALDHAARALPAAPPCRPRRLAGAQRRGHRLPLAAAGADAGRLRHADARQRAQPQPAGHRHAGRRAQQPAHAPHAAPPRPGPLRRLPPRPRLGRPPQQPGALGERCRQQLPALCRALCRLWRIAARAAGSSAEAHLPALLAAPPAQRPRLDRAALASCRTLCRCRPPTWTATPTRPTSGGPTCRVRACGGRVLG